METYHLGEEVLMEHAAMALCNAALNAVPSGGNVLIVCGPGNNGADGIACARMLQGKVDATVYLPYGTKSPMAKLQLKRAEALHVKRANAIVPADVVVDALFGSGIRPLDAKGEACVGAINALGAYTIACDIPTGLGVGSVVVRADKTVTMGALKTPLFLEEAKATTGEIEVADLGVARHLYEVPSKLNVLEKTDMCLPYRTDPGTHKGHFGHVAVVLGEKEGAAVLAATAAFAFGAGLVSVVGEANLPPHIMKASTLPENISAIVIGMGLGKALEKAEREALLLRSKIPVVVDADLCYDPIMQAVLSVNKPIVVTPHPKEFQTLLVHCGMGEHSVEEIQANRISLAQTFSEAFQCVLVLKGVHTLVAYRGEVMLSPFGSPALSKGGSGDVLSGLIGALLAQGYHAKEAAISAVLAHGLAAQAFNKNAYALTPQALIKGITCLKSE
jgi:hydroxyethylthiazole kinase-like uncharacterized protein yjeF